MIIGLLFVTVVFVIVLAVADVGTAMVIAVIQLLFVFSLRNKPYTKRAQRRDQKKHERLQALYDKMYDRYPHIRDNMVIERHVRQALIRRKIITAVAIYAVATACLLGASFTEEPSTVWAVLTLCGGGGAVFATMYFAKTLHDPCTPNERNSSTEFFRHPPVDSSGEWTPISPNPYYVPDIKNRSTAVYHNGRMYRNLSEDTDRSEDS